MSEPSGRLVLIVEDNPANLLLIRAVLRRGGFETAEASSGEGLRRELRRARPDAVLMDVRLGDEDGLTLTRALKSDPGTAAIPVVAVTAQAMAGDRERALAAGCAGYVCKPIDTRTLVSQIEAVIAATPAARAGEVERQ